MAESRKHKILKQTALRWMQGRGCVAFACEISMSIIGIVDVYGVKSCGDIYVAEAKASRADLKNDFIPHGIHGLPKITRFEYNHAYDFVYYILGHGIDYSELPGFIGILSESGGVLRRASRRPRVHTDAQYLQSFVKIAKACSWRAYGHVIRGESEQLEFALMED